MKRKPCSKGRVLHGPPAGWEAKALPGWYPSYTDIWRAFVSEWGRVCWYSPRARWYGEVRGMTYSAPVYCPRGGFRGAREAMRWVEEQYIRRGRSKTWKAVLR